MTEHPESVPEVTQLPCGCRLSMDDEMHAFYYQPCSTDCEYFAYAMREAQRQGKPVEAIDLRPEPPLPGPCPWCGKDIVGMTEIGAGFAHPSPGDVTICYECIEPSVFVTPTELRKMREDEIDPRIEKAMAMLQTFKDTR